MSAEADERDPISSRRPGTPAGGRHPQADPVDDRTGRGRRGHRRSAVRCRLRPAGHPTSGGPDRARTRAGGRTRAGSTARASGSACGRPRARAIPGAVHRIVRADPCASSRSAGAGAVLAVLTAIAAARPPERAGRCDVRSVMTAVTSTPPLCRVDRPALGTTAVLVVTDPSGLPAASDVLDTELAALDAACSRFRPDSEITRLHAQRGTTVPVGPLLAEAVTVALRAAELTNGVVDPTVGAAVRTLGYDRDFADVPRDSGPVVPTGPVPGWWRLGWDADACSLLVPHGVWLDLGATAKALAADRVAARAAAAAGCGVLVALGGDVALGGSPPDGGWQVGVGDDHTAGPDVTVSLTQGGLATSGTTRRRWRRGGRTVHHIVDPRTGDVAASCWRTATVAAASCVAANTASTAAVVMGPPAVAWLAGCGLPARLVAEDGVVTEVAGWPAARPA
jgi:FAD:protein FMN transferase